MTSLEKYARNVGDKNLLLTILFLNKIDLTRYILEQDSIGDIIGAIEDDYGHLVENDPVFQGFIFNHMSSEEFTEYLYDKYILYMEI